MIHLVKLAVGVRDISHLAEFQRGRVSRDPPLRHQTRSMPKRAAELTDGGSLYWVITGAILVRQRVIDVIEDMWDDGSPCAGLVLDPTLVRVVARSSKPFQGWRYLKPEDAPADLAAGTTTLADDLPLDMLRALTELALLP
jgi:hypothetical protein